jgi:YD repeat-containing protein
VTDAAGQTTTLHLHSQRPGERPSRSRRGSASPRSAPRRYTYDPWTGDVAGVTGPGGVSTSYTYDGYGRLRTSTNNDGYTLTYDYDTLQPAATRNHVPDGTYEETQYDRLRRGGGSGDRVGPLGHTPSTTRCGAWSARETRRGVRSARTWMHVRQPGKADRPQRATPRAGSNDIQGRKTRESARQRLHERN